MTKIVSAAAEFIAAEYGTPERSAAAHRLWKALGGAGREQLKQLLRSPTWDGDVVSKSWRDELLSAKLAERCCVGGEQGYTTATYPAGALWGLICEDFGYARGLK